MAIKLLLVEDNQMLRGALAAEFEEAGYEVLQATNGAEALSTLAEESVDLVLSDISMPVVNGFELCQEIGRLYPDLPVVLMSSSPVEEDALRLGARGFYRKGVGVHELHDTLRRALEEQKAD